MPANAASDTLAATDARRAEDCGAFVVGDGQRVEGCIRQVNRPTRFRDSVGIRAPLQLEAKWRP
jgi:hypothetical protein